ncbi:MAG: type II secretion system ATPase GspE [bacterium]
MNLANKTLGKAFLKEGVINQKDLDLVLQSDEANGDSLFKFLVEKRNYPLDKLMRALGSYFNLPYQEKIDEDVDSSLLANIPFGFVKRYKIMPFKLINDTIYVALSNPLNISCLDDIRLITGYQIEPVLCPEAQIMQAINRSYHHSPESAEKMVQDLDEEEGEKVFADLGEEDKDLLDLANEAPIIKLVNLILVQAIKDRASDIHIEPFEKDLRVRYRIDGVLYDTLNPPKRYQTAILSRIKIMSKMNIAEKRLPQDGRIKIKVGDREIDIRVSTVPTAFGERAVLRLLDKYSSFLRLEELGMSGKSLDQMNKLIQRPHGIILVTGPTGSGKTTSLYAALSKINIADKNILTVEDPIEYQLNGIGQIQVMPKINLTFSTGLRSILRQDPDVIMVGEIRDLETAEMAIQASLTGHLVFSTLHTNDSAGAVTRLGDMGVELYLIASSVIAILAQRLVRVICPYCKISYKPDLHVLKEIGLQSSDLVNDVVYRGTGCQKCLNTGYRGRTGIYELFLINDSIRSLIMEHTESNTLKKAALDNGMVTLRQDGINKVITGQSTIEEVVRVTQEDMF